MAFPVLARLSTATTVMRGAVSAPSLTLAAEDVSPDC